jgi:hypothetical protein
MIPTRHDSARRDISRSFAVALAAVACAASLAACGSSGKPSTGSSAGGEAQGIKFADCMRSHGVPSFPDPTSTPPSGPPAGGIAIGGGGGVFLSVPQAAMESPAFKRAATECGFPGGGPGGPKLAPAP